MMDLVTVLDADSLEPLFDGAQPMRVTVRESSKLTSWPVEDGTQRTDHRVLDPVEIDLGVLITEANKNLFESLRQTFIEGRALVVQSQVRSYPAMMIFEMPHDEMPETGDAVAVSVKLREVITIKPEFGTLPPSSVADQKQASTVKRGAQQTQAADAPTQRKSSTLYRIAN